MDYLSTKTYGHELGLSCAFRQWRASSHCRLLHGYALSFKFVFGNENLDERGWVVDFGGLSILRKKLENAFDHKTAVAADDPMSGTLRMLEKAGALDLTVFEKGVGCERFAEYAYYLAVDALKEAGISASVISCECREHGANSAIYKPGIPVRVAVQHWDPNV